MVKSKKAHLKKSAESILLYAPRNKSSAMFIRQIKANIGKNTGNISTKKAGSNMDTSLLKLSVWEFDQITTCEF